VRSHIQTDMSLETFKRPGQVSQADITLTMAAINNRIKASLSHVLPQRQEDQC